MTKETKGKAGEKEKRFSSKRFHWSDISTNQKRAENFLAFSLRYSHRRNHFHREDSISIEIPPKLPPTNQRVRIHSFPQFRHPTSDKGRTIESKSSNLQTTMSDFTNTTSQTLVQLRSIEDKLSNMLWQAGMVIDHLSKEPTPTVVDQYVRAFGEGAQQVQNLLHQSISNLERISSGLPHEDSCYSAWLDFNLASIRNENIRNKLLELKNHPQLHQSRERVKLLEAQLASL